MNMPIVSVANNSWLEISDPQALAMPLRFRNEMSAKVVRAATSNQPAPVPMLNWPSTLFDDARHSQ